MVHFVHAGGGRLFCGDVRTVLLGDRCEGVPEVDVLFPRNRDELNYHLHGAEDYPVPEHLGVLFRGGWYPSAERLGGGAHSSRLYRRVLAVPAVPLPQERVPEGVTGPTHDGARPITQSRDSSFIVDLETVKC